MTPHYRHTQIGWVIIGSIAAAIALVLPLLAVPGAPGPLLLVLLLLALAGVVFSTLTVEVDATEIRIRFTFGLVRKRVALAELRGQRPVRNPWRYGWGIHMIPGGWIWNVSGQEAVELLLGEGRVLRVGTDEPEALSRAIAEVAPAASTSTDAIAPAGPRRWSWVALAIVAAVVVGVVALLTVFYLQMRPPEVTVTPQQISIRTPFYGEDYPMAEITGVSLESRLPRILVRTNGFAAGGQLRGWFRLEGLGEGKLFLDVAAPPFVFLRLQRGFVILNLGEPDQTRALYAQIEGLRRP